MEQSSRPTLTDLILQVAAAATAGIALMDLVDLPGLAGKRRMIQRLLQALVGQGKLRKEGSTRGTRYYFQIPMSTAPSEGHGHPRWDDQETGLPQLSRRGHLPCLSAALGGSFGDAAAGRRPRFPKLVCGLGHQLWFARLL